MTQVVKNFIENTKYAISNNMWSVFFYEWFRETEKIWPAEEYEKELFHILRIAKITVDWDARKNVIIGATKNTIVRALTDLEVDYIPLDYLKSELPTYLQYSVKEIDELLHTSAKQMNLIELPDGKGFKW